MSEETLPNGAPASTLGVDSARGADPVGVHAADWTKLESPMSAERRSAPPVHHPYNSAADWLQVAEAYIWTARALSRPEHAREALEAARRALLYACEQLPERSPTVAGGAR